MTENLGDPPPAAPGSTATAAPPPAPSEPRRFRRSRSDRVVAGVAGGLAESLNLDPVIVRVLLVVLSFFGGAGIIVYGACWLLMPADDRETSLAERAIARGGRNPWPVLALVGALGLAVVLSAGIFIDDRGVLLIALLVIAAVLLARREDAQQPQRQAPPQYAPPPYASPQYAPPQHAPLAPATPPTPPRPRSILGQLTLCAILLALGVLGAVDLSGADVPAAAYPALVVAVTGLGLVVGAVFGRARGLIALGVLAALAIPPTAFADAYSGGWVDQDPGDNRPTDVAAIAPEYRYRGGQVFLDLSAVDFTDRTAATRIRIGVGEVVVTVPPNVDVTADVEVTAGEVNVFGHEQHGLGIEVERHDTGADGAGGGTLNLVVDQGAGSVEVRRADA